MPKLHIKSVQFPILNGPSKWDLAIGLFDRKPFNRRLEFRANVDMSVGQPFEVTLTSVEAEDGSGESWNIKGYAMEIIHRESGRTIPTPPRDVSIYYRTDTRKGHIKFLS